jgi:hypothetical protein
VRIARVALAVAALVLALGALATAREVGSRRDAIVRGDRTRAADPAVVVDWTPASRLPLDPAGRLTGLGDDIALREAIRAYVVAERTGEGFDNGRQRSRRRDSAASALENVIATGPPPAVARAEILLGVLLFDANATSVAAPGEQSVSAFSEAARLDPSSLAAKFDLELTLRALVPAGTRPGSNPAAGGKGQGRHGAGAGLPGSGF